MDCESFSAACSDEDDSSLLFPPVDIEGTEGTDNSSITKLAMEGNRETVAFLNESKDIPVNPTDKNRKAATRMPSMPNSPADTGGVGCL